MNSPSGSLSSADLAALESALQSGDVGSLVGEALGPTGGNTSAVVAANLAAASETTRADVQGLSGDVFDRHIFDPYLHFTSAADEAAFRAHEDEIKKYVAAQLARGTPEGNLNASGGMMDYMLDAHAHGAGDSPDFMPRWNRLVADTERQRTAMIAAGQSTEEFDRKLTDRVRRYLKAKGLSDSEIDAQLARSDNPLDAANRSFQTTMMVACWRFRVRRIIMSSKRTTFPSSTQRPAKTRPCRTRPHLASTR